MNRNWLIAAILAFVVFGAGVAGVLIHAQASDDEIIEGVPQIVDAGTLRMGEKTVKLHGIIAPAARQKCRKGALPWLCGAAARKHLVELVQERIVKCKVVSGYFAKCSRGSVDLARDLVRNGWAVADKSGKIYHPDEDIARAKKLGMWKYAK